MGQLKHRPQQSQGVKTRDKPQFIGPSMAKYRLLLCPLLGKSILIIVLRRLGVQPSSSKSTFDYFEGNQITIMFSFKITIIRRVLCGFWVASLRIREQKTMMMTRLLVGYCWFFWIGTGWRGLIPRWIPSGCGGRHKQIKKQRAIHSSTRQETQRNE